MLVRLLPMLLSLWLLASAQGFGVHVHGHTQGADREHTHLVSAFDDAHELAHASGAADQDEPKAAPRTSTQPDMAPLPTAFLTRSNPAEFDVPVLACGLRTTGPPPHLRPPSQAPPRSYALS